MAKRRKKNEPTQLTAVEAAVMLSAVNDARAAARKLSALAAHLGVRGICRTCGCTELEGCPGGCAWVDYTKTLCDRCEGA